MLRYSKHVNKNLCKALFLEDLAQALPPRRELRQKKKITNETLSVNIKSTSEAGEKCYKFCAHLEFPLIRFQVVLIAS